MISFEAAVCIGLVVGVLIGIGAVLFGRCWWLECETNGLKDALRVQADTINQLTAERPKAKEPDR